MSFGTLGMCAHLPNSVRPCKSKFVVFIIRKKFERVKVRAPKGERQNAELKVLKLAILTMLDIICHQFLQYFILYQL